MGAVCQVDQTRKGLAGWGAVWANTEEGKKHGDSGKCTQFGAFGMWCTPWRRNSRRQGIKKLLGQMTVAVTEQCPVGKEHSQISLSDPSAWRQAMDCQGPRVEEGRPRKRLGHPNGATENKTT